MDDNLKPVETISPELAGKLIHKNPEWIRAKIRQGVVWGDCTQVTPGQWSYVIIKNKFLEFIGIKSEVIINENQG